VSVSDWPVIKIVNEQAHGKATQVFIDGVEQHGLVGAKVTFDRHDANRVVLTSFANAMEVEVKGLIVWRVWLKHPNGERIFGEAPLLVDAVRGLAEAVRSQDRKDTVVDRVDTFDPGDVPQGMADGDI
jgi:hypothetical protein